MVSLGNEQEVDCGWNKIRKGNNAKRKGRVVFGEHTT
jgi:hypothetical protein